MLRTLREKIFMYSCDFDNVASMKSRVPSFILFQTTSSINKSIRIGGVTQRRRNLHQLPKRASGVDGSAKASL